MKRNLVRFLFVFVTAAFCSGCYTRSSVITGVSGQLKEYYTIYPSVEVDIAAVTAAEADKIQALSVEDYWDSFVRRDVSPHTVTFSSEQTTPRVMKRDTAKWKGWLKKKPEKLVVVANLPGKTEKTEKKGDPRILILDLETSWFWPDTLYFEIKPGSVVRIYKKPVDPELNASKKKKAFGKKG